MIWFTSDTHFGHGHGRLDPLTRQIDVGVDAWDYAPVSLETLAEKVTRRRRSTS